ncbi:DUF262 domain-containing protein [Deinococcus sedimenti]|uniref:DUF262 domain-containing protein n=1 Tax=Deinococcus sedimenti TaxID=1867090 RepID=A0ABQ2SAD9_9DEIO|nr:DUF262 domain-containing protein [Deinococcus sedimenti]GGS05773.1 hypothetical protein GCM10008960_35350 [Deinococcus sedimenti]
MSVRIHGSEHPVQKIFSDDFAFTIPPYQRPYSWTTEQAEALLDDLLESVNNASRSEQEPYFLGSIVLIKEEGKPPAEVIDGQQRLTTLTILLAALRETMAKSGVAAASELNHYIFQKGSQITNVPDRPRLRIRDRDNVFFREVIQEACRDLNDLRSVVLSDPQKNLKNNYEAYLGRLSALTPDQRLSLATHILTNCFLVTVSTPNMESAYRIFSVMNDRGLDLSYTDILKAEIIGAVGEPRRETYTAVWEDIEEELGRSGFENLFSHLRTAIRRVKAQDTLLKELRTYVKPQQQPEKFIDATLQPYAEAYRIIRRQEYEATTGAEKVNEMTGWLSKIDNEDWVPPALAFFVRYRQEPQLLIRFFTALERLAVVMLLTRANVNERINRYAEVLLAIERGTGIFGPSSPLHIRPAEAERAVATLNGDIYNFTKINRYVLLRLDAALSGAGAKYDQKIISIEHVLPQNPRADSHWMQWFPEASDRERWTHRLANLVLLAKTKNSQARNFEFDKKKTSYFQGVGGVSPFALTTQVLSESAWTPESLEIRQRELTMKLIELWKLDGNHVFTAI